MSRDSYARPDRLPGSLPMRVLYRLMRHPLWVTKDEALAERSRMEWGEMNGGHEWYLSTLGAINGLLPRLTGHKLAFYEGGGRLTLIVFKPVKR